MILKLKDKILDVNYIKCETHEGQLVLLSHHTDIILTCLNIFYEYNNEEINVNKSGVLFMQKNLVDYLI
jgi:F0F1-type ATP synthase epsilon subunit